MSAAARLRSLSTSAFTRGTMYNWRVKALLTALEREGRATGPLQLQDLTSLGHLDQYHYLGTEACDHVIELLGVQPDASVLDVGAGIGGPARYIAANTGCRVVGVELQSELSEAAAELTARVVGLADRVSFMTGDFSSDACAMPQADFDHLISLLVFLHIPDRTALLRRCHSHLRPGGTFVIEDFVKRGEFTAQESSTLLDLVKAPSVTSTSEYIAALNGAGFVDVEAEDLSAVWQAWTKARHELYLQTEEETVAQHGKALFDERRTFYEAIDMLFAGGNLGGVRITGRRPGPQELALRTGRLTSSARPASMNVQVVEGKGGTMDHAAAAAAAASLDATLAAKRPRNAAAATGTTSAQLLSPSQSEQPAFPATVEGHDSLQYHFFFPGLFVAARVFSTASLQHHSAWLCTTADGVASELHSTNRADTQLSASGGPKLALSGDEMRLSDDASGASLTLAPRGEASALLSRMGVPVGASGRPELTITFDASTAYGWLPATQEAAGNMVLHRPDLACRVAWGGASLAGVGYSKRYYGDYPRYWGYRFIHGVGATAAADDAAMLALSPQDPARAVLWNADATFGEGKYNYFKLLRGGAPLVESTPEATYQIADCGYATIDGGQYSAQLSEVARWSAIITDDARSMESRMENRLCRLTVRCADGVVYEGLAYNERCFGTLG